MYQKTLTLYKNSVNLYKMIEKGGIYICSHMLKLKILNH